MIFGGDRRFEYGHGFSSYFGQILQGFQDSIGAGIHPDRREVTPGDDAVFVDDKEGALADSIGSAVGAILSGDGSLGFKVGEQFEVQVASFGIGFVGPRAIDGDAKQLGSELLELGENFVIEADLVATGGAPVGGIEGENYGFAEQFAKRKSLLRCELQGEVRRLGARSEQPGCFRRSSVCRS